MIDIHYIEEHPEEVKERLKKKNWDFDPKPVLDLIEERRSLRHEVEAA